jgi:tRNA pseudouridine55 synthase
MAESGEELHGVVVIDKPGGCTSHDVVQRVRRALGQRSVGHAGTLDPLATGVLVVAVGEGTKLVSYLQADDKRYEVTIALGEATDTLDADGTVVEAAQVPPLDAERVTQVIRPFIGTHAQRAPKVSAIKVGGRALHEWTRRGEDVEAPMREVELHEVDVLGVDGPEVRLGVHCGKGFYVRSLARDFAEALGTVGHVKVLRRTESGPFTLKQAVFGDSLTREAIEAKLVSLGDACGGLPRLELDEAGVADARHGRRVSPSSTAGGDLSSFGPEQTFALFGPDGEPVALARREGDLLRVVRGFVQPQPRSTA